MTSALLVMDCQQGTIERQQASPLLGPLQRAVAAARDARVTVVFVRTVFRKSFPEVSAMNKSFRALRDDPSEDRTDDSPATQIHPALDRRPEDPVVVKKRVSAFTGSDLSVLLRSMSFTDLVLCGIATSGVVLSTLREAADLDFGLTVLSDCCWDTDDEVHRVLTEKVFPRQATVLRVDEWTRGLAR